MVLQEAATAAKDDVQLVADHADETTAPGGGDVLAVDIPGAFIGKRSERLQVRVAGEVVAEAPLFRLRQVIVGSRGVSISSDAIQACARRDITIHVVGRWPGDAAMLGTPVGNATVATTLCDAHSRMARNQNGGPRASLPALVLPNPAHPGSARDQNGGPRASLPALASPDPTNRPGSARNRSLGAPAPSPAGSSPYTTDG